MPGPTMTTTTREKVDEAMTQAQQQVRDAQRQVRKTLAEVRHKAEDARTEAQLRIRRQPFAAVGMAACVGTTIGLLMGIALGYSLSRR